MMQPRDVRIACVGGCDVDRTARLAAAPEFGSSNPVSVATSSGGVARNVAETLARLGCQASLFSVVGGDKVGAMVLDRLVGVGVDVTGVDVVDDEPTATYTAVLEPEGGLVMGLADMAILDNMDTDWVDAATPSLARHNVWFVDANLPAASLAHLLRRRRARGVAVLADPVSVAKAPRLAPVLDALDAVFPDAAEAAVLAGADGDEVQLAKLLRQRGAGAVVITRGAEGVLLSDEEGTADVPALAGGTVVDVTGAGDALIAGFIYGTCMDGDVHPIRYGLAAASLALETPGSVSEDLSPARLAARLDRLKVAQ